VDARFLLSKDGVDAHSGLTGLTVADDELTLAASDRSHGVDGFQAGGHRLAHALTGDDAGGLDFHGTDFGSFDRSETVDGLAERVKHAARHLVANRHGENLAGTFDGIAFLDACVRAKKGNTDVVFFQVQNHAHDAAREFEEFHGHGVLDAVNTGDTVTNVEDGAGLAHLYALIVVLNLFLNDFADFVCFNLHVLFTPLESLPEVLQLRAQARIQHTIANLEDNAP